MKQYVVGTSLFATTFALSASPAAAQDQLPAPPASASSAEAPQPSNADIIVTAQRRGERLQQVPIAITALSSEALQNQGIANLSDLSRAAPSLKIVAYPNSSDTLTLTMRGQGAGNVGEITKDGGVSLYVDGFFVGRPQGALLDLGDPERIEVLRGPQGTLYGRNTTGGAINIITQKPSGEWGGSGTLSYGSRNLVRALGSVDLPAFGNFSIKASAVYVNQDGWVKNPGAQHNYGEFGQIAGRISTKWTPSDSVRFFYNFDIGRVETTPLYYVNPDLVGIIPGYTANRDRTYAPLDFKPSVSHFVDHQLTAEVDLSDSFKLRSLSGYRGFRAYQYTNYGVAQSSPDFPITVTSNNYYRTRQFTQEFQIVGDITDRLDFTGGLFYYHEKARHVVDQTLGLLLFGFTQATHSDIRAKSQSYAGYMQSTWTPPVLGDRLKITGGGRYTRDKRQATRDRDVNGEVTENGASNRQPFSNFSPMVTVAMEWSRDLMTFAKVSKGYKAGGSSELAADFTQTFGPEKVTAFEAGFKAQFFDRVLTLNASAFLNKFDDIQIDFVTDPVDTSVGITANAGKAQIKGVEIESVIQPTPDITLRVAYNYLKPTVKTVTALAGTVFDPAVNPNSPFQAGQNIAGYFTLPFVPRHSISLGADMVLLRTGSNEFSAHGNYAYQSGVITSAGAGPLVSGHNLYRNDPTNNVDLRLTWARELQSAKTMRLSFFADNLLNDRRSDFVIGIGSVLDGFRSRTSPYNEPRTLGAELRIDF